MGRLILKLTALCLAAVLLYNLLPIIMPLLVVLLLLWIVARLMNR